MFKGVGVVVIPTPYTDGKRCQYYARWKNMIRRCYSRNQDNDVVVCDDWLVYSNFKYWMIQQEKLHGDLTSLQLDKDILSDGLMYSPSACAFVTAEVNLFVHVSRKPRNLPIGVTISDRYGYKSQCRNPFDRKSSNHIGYFDTKEDAHEAWRLKKHEYACRLADIETDPRVSISLRSRYVKCNHDNMETIVNDKYN